MSSAARPRVPAGPSIDHVRRLLDTGLRVVDIADRTRLAYGTIRDIAAGRAKSVTPHVAELVAAIPVPDQPPVRLDLGWQVRAACAEIDPETFFPGKGGTSRPAKKVYAACPVLSDCRAYARALRVTDGVWAGQNANDIRRTA